MFKPGQENIMAAFKKYAKRRIGKQKSIRKLVREARSGRGVLQYAPTSDVNYSYFMKNPKRPATRRGSFTRRATARVAPNEEGSMVYSLKRRPRRKSHRRARHNSYRDSGLFGRLTGKGSRKRRSHRRSRRIRLGAHRPIVIRTAHAWRRPKRSRLFRRATRINPRRSRRYGRRSYRRNPLGLPKLPFNLQNVAFGGLKIAGGIAIGMLGMPLIVKHIAPMVDKTGQYRKFYGLVHVVLGAVAAATIRKQIVKEIALTVAGVGVYDLISQNLPMLGLPTISALSGDFIEPGVVGMEADMEPALMGASYQALGASYGRDDIAYGNDNDSLDC